MAQARRPLTKRHGPLVAALSLAAHLSILAALFSARFEAPKAEPDVAPIPVELVQLPPPPPKVVKEPAPAPPSPAPPAAAPPSPAKPPPRRKIARPARAPPPPDVEPLPAGETTLAEGEADEGVVSDAELASAATAGSGGAGHGCDMARRLQTALRKDRRVQSAVAEAQRGKALRVWNGDWVRHTGQEGAGLAAVRETIMWEVGFAPEACRTERVRGLVLISLNDGPGAARLVVGAGDWRWSDMLFARAGSRGNWARR